MGKNIIKVLSFLLCLCAVFALLQAIITPKYPEDSTMIVEGFSELEKNSLDVLAIGSSQMFCAVNPDVLRQETGAESYVFGGSSQRLPVTAYYLEQALKRQSPRVVLLEVCMLWEDSGAEDEAALSWSFDPMPLSWGKLKTLYQIFDGDLSQTLSHALPLWQRHARWNQLEELDYIWPFEAHPSESGGFLYREEVKPVVLEFPDSDPDTPVAPIPEDNIAAIQKIRDICRAQGITLIAFKAPSGNWTRAMSGAAKALMDDLEIRYWDCMDNLEEIGLNPETDFFNRLHLNADGAEKVTRFLAQLPELKNAIESV